MKEAVRKVHYVAAALAMAVLTGCVVERYFTTADDVIVVESPFDFVLRSTEYAKPIKDKLNSSAIVEYRQDTPVAVTNWCHTYGASTSIPWHGYNVSGLLTFDDEDAVLAHVHLRIGDDQFVSERECATLLRKVVEEVDDRAGVMLQCEDRVPEAKLQVSLARSPGEEIEVVRYGGMRVDGVVANEYHVTGSIDDERRCFISFEYGALERPCCNVPSSEMDRLKSNSGTIESIFDLEMGTTNVAARLRNCLLSLCEYRECYGRKETNWTHRMAVSLSTPYHGFDMALLAFSAGDFKLESYFLETDASNHPMTEAECIREVKAIVSDYEKRVGVAMKEQDYSQIRERGKRGRVITAWHGGVKSSANEKVQYSVAGLRDKKDKERCRLILHVFIARNGSWCLFPDSFDEPSFMTLHY